MVPAAILQCRIQRSSHPQPRIKPSPHLQPRRNVLYEHLFDAMADHAHHGVLAYTIRKFSIAGAIPGPLQAFGSLKLAPLSCVVPAATLQRRI